VSDYEADDDDENVSPLVKTTTCDTLLSPDQLEQEAGAPRPQGGSVPPLKKNSVTRPEQSNKTTVNDRDFVKTCDDKNINTFIHPGLESGNRSNNSQRQPKKVRNYLELPDATPRTPDSTWRGRDEELTRSNTVLAGRRTEGSVRTRGGLRTQQVSTSRPNIDRSVNNASVGNHSSAVSYKNAAFCFSPFTELAMRKVQSAVQLPIDEECCWPSSVSHTLHPPFTLEAPRCSNDMTILD